MKSSAETPRRRRLTIWAGCVGGLLTVAALSACSTTPSRIRGQAAPPVLCADFSFPIYFEKGSDQLTAQARQEISFAAARVKGCTLGPVAVFGLADADGAVRRNLVLSRQRAVIVAEALAASGLPAPTFDIQALGESGAVAPGGDRLPLRRRAEVVIRASAPSPHTSDDKKSGR
jgi:flagellar motor protein MotB